MEKVKKLTLDINDRLEEEDYQDQLAQVKAFLFLLDELIWLRSIVQVINVLSHPPILFLPKERENYGQSKAGENTNKRPSYLFDNFCSWVLEWTLTKDIFEWLSLFLT